MNRLLILDGDAPVYHQAITACDLPDLSIAVADFLSGTPLEHVVDFSWEY